MNMLSVVREIERLKKLALAKKVEFLRKPVDQLSSNDESVLKEKIKAFKEVRRSLLESTRNEGNEELKVSLDVIEKNIQDLEMTYEKHLDYGQELRSLNMFVKMNMNKFIREKNIKFSTVEVRMTKSFRKNKDLFIQVLNDNGYILNKNAKQSARCMRFYTIDLDRNEKRELVEKLAKELFVDQSLIVGNFQYSTTYFEYMRLIDDGVC